MVYVYLKFLAGLGVIIKNYFTFQLYVQLLTALILTRPTLLRV